MVVDANPLPIIVGVRFSKIGKNYFFDASKVGDVQIGDHLVVETSRGWQIGELSEIITDTKIRSSMKYKPVDRKATQDDLIKKEQLTKSAEDAIKVCQSEIRRLGIESVKIVTAEVSFDEKNLSFIYTTTIEEAPNLNALKSVMGKTYPKMHIDYHKIGPRDVARYLGGMGACGFACRCCAKFLKNFESISINMAKKQGISLTPSDITGMCDRLRCCLQYEYCNYVEALNHLPRRNKFVQTPKGHGKVVDVAPLTNTVYVFIEDVGVKGFDAAEISEAPVSQIAEPSTSSLQPQDKNRRRRQRPKNQKEK